MKPRTVALMLAVLLVPGCASMEKAGAPAESPGLARMNAVNESLMPSTEKVARLAAIDEEMHAPLVSSLPAQSTATLQDLLTASDIVRFYAQNADRALVLRHVSRMGAIFEELNRRNAASHEHAALLFDAYVAARDFPAAARLAEDRKSLREMTIPAVRNDDDFDESMPALLSLEPHGGFTARNVSIRQGDWIIAVVGCPISQEMVEAIAVDPELAPQLRDANIVWVMPADRLDAAMVRAWNHHFPEQPVVVAYENAAWGPVEFDSMPEVFFLRDGALVARVGGWDPESTLGKLRNALADFR